MNESEPARLHTYLLISRASGPERVIVWDTVRIRIGRHFEQDLVLENPEVSREHALLRREGDQFVAEDLSTANGTFVNGEGIRTRVLAPNDRIQIAEWTLTFCRSLDNPAATLPNVTYASHLKDFHPLADGEGDRTMLGLEDGDDSIWDTDPRTGRKPASAAPVRNLDAELAAPDPQDGSAPAGPPPTEPRFSGEAPDDPDPLMASAFDLGEPLPPVGRRVADSPHPGANEFSAPTTPRGISEGADAPRRSVEITLRLDGVDPELLRLLQSLLGERFDTRALSVLLKAIAIK
jgi:predicted component of type VI protein secretion system